MHNAWRIPTTEHRALSLPLVPGCVKSPASCSFKLRTQPVAKYCVLQANAADGCNISSNSKIKREVQLVISTAMGALRRGMNGDAQLHAACCC